MRPSNLLFGTAFTGSAIILGAFASHGLEEILSEEMHAAFRTGIRYQIYHGLALLFLHLYHESHGTKQREPKGTGILFITGTFLFSGSLYALAINSIYGWDELGGLFGPLTPIGGVCFIVGWGLLFFRALKPSTVPFNCGSGTKR